LSALFAEVLLDTASWNSAVPKQLKRPC